MPKDMPIREWIFEESIKRAIIDMVKTGLTAKEALVLAARVMQRFVNILTDEEGTNDE